jgi:hypothetical protein
MNRTPLVLVSVESRVIAIQAFYKGIRVLFAYGDTIEIGDTLRFPA